MCVTWSCHEDKWCRPTCLRSWLDYLRLLLLSDDISACHAATVEATSVVRRQLRPIYAYHVGCIRSWMSRRPIFGGYAALMRDIKSNGLKAYLLSDVSRQLRRLWPVAPSISHKDTNCRGTCTSHLTSEYSWTLDLSAKHASRRVHTVLSTCRRLIHHAARLVTETGDNVKKTRCHKAGDRLPLPPGLASCRASLPFG